MKIFLIGGVTEGKGSPGFDSQMAMLRGVTTTIVESLLSAGHHLIVCSPFDGSIDAEVLRAAATLLPQDGSSASLLSLYYPDDEKVAAAMKARTDSLPPNCIRTSQQPLTSGQNGEVDWQYSWLLAQLAALDSCDAVLALGGKINRATNLLLQLAEARRRPILSLDYLNGAASASFRRRRYELADLLGDDLALLNNPSEAGRAATLIESLVNRKQSHTPLRENPDFFISYARERHSEADFVETILRRRNHEVFRDEHTFGAGAHLPTEITEQIYKADVFIALWCKEYACSPWCYDELSFALDRKSKGDLHLWILALDDTRIVPPLARNLISYDCQTRDDLEHHVLKQLETFN